VAEPESSISSCKTKPKEWSHALLKTKQSRCSGMTACPQQAGIQKKCNADIGLYGQTLLRHRICIEMLLNFSNRRRALKALNFNIFKKPSSGAKQKYLKVSVYPLINPTFGE